MSGLNGSLLIACGKVGEYCIYQQTRDTFVITKNNSVVAYVGSLKAGKEYIREQQFLNRR